MTYPIDHENLATPGLARRIAHDRYQALVPRHCKQAGVDQAFVTRRRILPAREECEHSAVPSSYIVRADLDGELVLLVRGNATSDPGHNRRVSTHVRNAPHGLAARLAHLDAAGERLVDHVPPVGRRPLWKPEPSLLRAREAEEIRARDHRSVRTNRHELVPVVIAPGRCAGRAAHQHHADRPALSRVGRKHEALDRGRGVHALRTPCRRRCEEQQSKQDRRTREERSESPAHGLTVAVAQPYESPDGAILRAGRARGRNRHDVSVGD